MAFDLLTGGLPTFANGLAMGSSSREVAQISRLWPPLSYYYFRKFTEFHRLSFIHTLELYLYFEFPPSNISFRGFLFRFAVDDQPRLLFPFC